jgi:hypothetical protein
MAVSLPGLNPPEDEPPPLLLSVFPLVLVGSDVGTPPVAPGNVAPVAVLALVAVAIVASVVSAGADAGTYPACEQ